MSYKNLPQIIVSLFLLFSNFTYSQNNALVLNGGIAVMSGGTAGTPAYLVVNQINTNGILRNSGHIHSENQYNYVKWLTATSTGNYLVPFGVGGNATDYIPFTFNKTTASSSNVQTSTWFTDVPNYPRPATTNVGAVTNMFNFADSVQFAIDRFWDIQTSAATTADLTFSYRGIENTTINPTGNVRAQHWNGSSWDAPVLPGNPGVTTGIGLTGPFVGQNTFSPWILSVVPICPEDTISYAGSPYCNNISTPQAISHTNGTMVGTYSALPAGLSIDFNTGAITPNLSTPGIYTVTFVVSATPTCPDFVTTTSVTISPMDDATFTYLQGSYCLTEANPQPNSVTMSGGTFTINNGGVITGTTGEINLAATGIGNFTVTYITNGSCPDTATFSIVINNNYDATIDTTGVNNFCVNDAATNLSAATSGGTWSGTGITNTTNGTFDPSAAGVGTHQIIYTITGSCGSADTTTILVNPLPTINVPNGGQVCEGSTLNLTPSSGGIWTSSNPSVATVDNAGLVTGISAGTANMVFTDATTGCSNTLVAGLVTVNPRPTINVPNGGQVCEGSILNLTPSTGGTWTSSNPSVATIDNAGLVTGISAGTANMVFTDATTGCSNTLVDGLVTVNPRPTINVPNGGQVCEGSILNLTPSTGGTWTSSNPAVATVDNAGLVTGISAGTANMVFTDSTTGCSNTLVDGLVTVNPIPIVNNQNPQVCEDAATPGTASNIDLTALNNAINGGAGTNTWYNDAGLTSNVTTPTNVSVTNGQVFYVEVDNGMCTSVATVTFTVTNTIFLNSVSPTFCEETEGSGNISNINLNNYNNAIYSGISPIYVWYFDAGLSNPVIPQNSTTITNNLTLYVDVVDGTCNNSISVTFVVTPLPTITVPNGGQVCEGSTLNLTPSTGGTWTSSNPSVATIDNAGLVSGISAGTANMVFTDATTGCSNTLVDGLVTVNPRPTINIPNGGQVCEGSTLNLTPSSGGIWTSSNPSIATIDNVGLVTGISAGIANMIFTDLTTACSSSTSSGWITVRPTPIINVPSGGIICEGSTLNLTPSTGGTWTSSNPSVATIDNMGLVTGISAGTANMVFTDATTGCFNTLVAGLVTVNPRPSINIPNGGQVCEGSTLNLTPSSGGVWTSSNPAVATVDNAGLVTGISAGTANMVFTDATTGCFNTLVAGLITVNPIPNVTVPFGGIVCKGTTLNLTPSTGGTWTSSNPAVATINNSGLVTGISFGNANMVFTDATTGCSSNASFGIITVNGVTAVVNASPNTGFMPLNVVFNNTGSIGTTYSWSFGDTSATLNTFEVNHAYNSIGNYVATLIVTDGVCFDTAKVVIEVKAQSSIVIPNIFTPNGDGNNDLFSVSGKNITEVKGEIFNRWGQKLYEWNNIKGGWDGRTIAGTEVSDGTYFFIINAKGIDDEIYSKKGTLTLIR